MVGVYQPLTPWHGPDGAELESTEIRKRVKRLREVVAGRAALSEDDAALLGAVASAMVEKEAPGAPQAIRDEATIRLCGYLAGADYGGIAEESVDVMTTKHFPNHGMAFRHSGAKALLAPWKVRHARRVG